MKRFAAKAFLATGALALAAAVSAEDLTIVSRVDLGKGKTATSTQYLSATKVRTSDGENDTILDLATGRMVVIDSKKKEYWETSLQDMAAAMQKMQQELANSPMAGMFGKAEDVKVEKGTEAKKVAGYDTQHWILSMGEGLRWELWAAPALEAPTQFYDASKAQYLTMGPMGQRFVKMVEEMRKVKGFPLATRVTAKMMMIKLATSTEATEVRKGAIPAAAFEVPAGYKRKDAPFKKAA